MTGFETFEWDDAKDASNRAKHGIGFTVASRIFAGPVLTRTDDRFAYGEDRFIAVGVVGTVTLTVVYTIREPDVCRLISARRASRHERRVYEEARASRH